MYFIIGEIATRKVSCHITNLNRNSQEKFQFAHFATSTIGILFMDSFAMMSLLALMVANQAVWPIAAGTKM